MVIGIDYSLTCPAMCIMAEPKLDKCMFYFLTTNKRFCGVFKNVIGVEHENFYSEQERYDNIAEFFVNKIPTKELPSIFIEDYSFGSTGRVFHIAENMGMLKYKLWEVGYKFETVPPKTVKKFATEKGNADKQKMYETFYNETGEDFVMFFNKNLTLGSPVTDLVDSYYIAKYGYNKVHQKGTVK